MKGKLKKILIPVVLLLLVIVVLSSAYTVRPNEYVCTVRFSKIINTVSEPGLHFKMPFVDSVKTFPKTTMLYDIPPSEVLTSDKKNMTVDSYVLWQINDPLAFFKSLGTIGEAEERLNAITYNALKNSMGTLPQSAIINQEDASERNDIYENITQDVASIADAYGISIIDIKVKRLDLPADNEQAVYGRMISERNQIAEKYLADGDYEASIIRNDVDKQVNITVSDAKAQAAKLEAEGEAAYMKRLAEAYDSKDKKEFYEFTLALDALKASLDGSEKTVILSEDSELAKILMNAD